jgi:activator of HSP90 ATPase
MKESLEVSAMLNETAENLYKAWLDSALHSKFTGSPAEIDPSVNGKFSAWDGYISGTNISLEPYGKIVQAWKTSDFSRDEEDSVLEVLFENLGDKTRITLKHYNIPEGQGEDYKQGWQDFYFKPMKKYFNGKRKK